MPNETPLLAKLLLKRKGFDAWYVYDELMWPFPVSQWALQKSGEALQQTMLNLQQRIRVIYSDQPDRSKSHAFTREIFDRTKVPKRRFMTVIDGWNLLLVRQRPRDWQQMETILDMIGGTMALALAPQFGLDPEQHKMELSTLGKAVTYTQILSRLSEHLSQGRVPFAETELERFRVAPQDLANRVRTAQFQDLMWFQVRRISAWLEEAQPIISAVDKRDQKTLRILIQWQRLLLEKMQASGFDLMNSNIELSKWESYRLAWFGKAAAKKESQG